jgi:uracil-DNA glycosylase family protein
MKATLKNFRHAAARPDPSPEQRLAQLADEAALCQRCTLFRNATQVVFGEGPADAQIMMIGEQPGDREDLAGRPFVGPAGRILDKALQKVGLERSAIYVTNTVKHFKHEQRGKRRLHKHPNRFEVEQCRWWLDGEFKAIDPKLVIALGATAASALMGRRLTLASERGRLLRWPDGRAGLATIHPSVVLRSPDEAARSKAFDSFVGDLRIAVALMKSLSGVD